MNVPAKYIVCALTYMLITACKDKKEVIFPTTDLEIQVKNEKGELVENAVVAIFDNEQAYKDAYKNFSTVGSIKVDTTKKGVAKFLGIDPTKYYVATFYKDYNYKDYKKYNNNTYIMHDNDVSGYKLINSLNKGSITKADVQLTPAETLVSFWASDSLTETVPIKIKTNRDTLGTLTKTLAAKPTEFFSPNTQTVKLRRGVNSYYVVNTSGCTTIDTLQINGGDISNYAINVNRCVTGIVSFWSVRANTGLKIDVIINSNTKVGTIMNMLQSAPQSCKEKGTVYYSMVPGVHTYTATATGCAWTGTFTISGTGCSPQNIIKLDLCK